MVYVTFSESEVPWTAQFWRPGLGPQVFSLLHQISFLTSCIAPCFFFFSYKLFHWFYKLCVCFHFLDFVIINFGFRCDHRYRVRFGERSGNHAYGFTGITWSVGVAVFYKYPSANISQSITPNRDRNPSRGYFGLHALPHFGPLVRSLLKPLLPQP